MRGQAKGFGMRSAFALRIDSGIIFFICISAKPAELVGAKPLHLLTADRSAA